MEKYFKILKKSPLFGNISEENLKEMMPCLNVQFKKYEKENIVLMEGESVKSIGLVIEGTLHITRYDYNGNRTLVASLDPSDIFAEALCYAKTTSSPVTVTSKSDSIVMLFDFSKVMEICTNACQFHSQLIANMLQLLAQKNLYLQSRLEITSLKSLRARVLTYFSHFSKDGKSNITIPLNRQEMADYLCVDRSALSHELIKMKEEGLLDYKKNQFELFYLL